MISQVISLYTSRLLPPQGYFPNSHYSVSEEHCNLFTSAWAVFFVARFMSALIVLGKNVTLHVDMVTFSGEQL